VANNSQHQTFRPSLAAKVFVTLVFALSLAIPILLQSEADAPKPQKEVSEVRAYALEYFGFYLDDVSEDLGIDFRHRTDKLDRRLNHILPTIASTGASVAVSDFNNDGWNDFYLTTSKTGEPNALYKNLGDGNFKNVAEQLGVGKINEKGTGVSTGAVWGDINNDGYEDLLVYKWGKPELFLNEGGQHFRNISESAGLPKWLNANSAIWLDYNNDGNLDLLIGGYYKADIDLWKLENTLIMPESFEYANNGGRNYLLENAGNNSFKDVTFSKGLTSTKWTLALGSYDIDGNGLQDIFIANDYSVDELYLNYGARGFEEVGKNAKIGYAPKSGMNVSIGDIANDGRLSIYVSNITEMGILLQGNNLWQPSGNGGPVTFSNRAGAVGVELGGWSYGSQFGDLNNDGFQDLYLANGYISAARNNSYWYDYSKVTGGNEAIISDALNWPAMQGRSQSGYQHNKIWINGESGVFADVSDYVTDTPPYDSRAVALVDLWNRGVLDVIVANQANKVAVLKNIQREASGNWLAFKLEGTVSNRSAIGASVTLHWDDMLQTQIVTGGVGFSAQNQRALQFGIGSANTVEKVDIMWPSGRKQIIASPAINQLHVVKEEKDVS
jgi:hypothetical protein